MLTMCKELQSDKRQYDQIIQCTDFAMITITITGAFNKCHHLLNIYFIPSPVLGAFKTLSHSVILTIL